MCNYYLVIGRYTFAHVTGLLYVKSSSYGNTKYWKCRDNSTCSARKITFSAGNSLLIKKGGKIEDHNHAPNREEVKALKIVSSLKISACDHPERPPSAILRITQNAEPAVQAYLPNRENLRRNIQRERLRDMPSCPTLIEDLGEIANKF